MASLTKKQGNQIFSDFLSAPLKEIGFTIQRDGVIKRKFKYGFDEITYEEIKPWGAQFRLDYSADKRIDPIEEIWDDYLSELMRVGESYVSTTLAFDANRIKDYEYDPVNLRERMLNVDTYKSKQTEEGVSEMANQFLNNIKLYIVPTFDKFNNIQVLDAFVNGKPDYYHEVIHLFSAREALIYKKMIIAKLAGNKDYELVCEAMKQRILKAEEGSARLVQYLLVYEEVYERLKTVEPLANPILD